MTGKKGKTPSNSESRCAYRDADLAHHVAPLNGQNPSALRSDVIGSLKYVVNYDQSLIANHISRIGRMAGSDVYWCPKGNIVRLPVLKAILEEHGYVLQYSTIHAADLRRVIIGCADSDRRREHKRLLQKPGENTEAELRACRL